MPNCNVPQRLLESRVIQFNRVPHIDKSIEWLSWDELWEKATGSPKSIARNTTVRRSFPPPALIKRQGKAQMPQTQMSSQSYYIWTIGCQMNKADSERLAGALEGLATGSAPRPKRRVSLS